MIDHLPECRRFFTDMPAPDECSACGMFRICEQRVLGKRVYVEAYRSGREDACTAVAIFLALNGFRPNEKEWVERMKAAVMGGPM